MPQKKVKFVFGHFITIRWMTISTFNIQGVQLPLFLLPAGAHVSASNIYYKKLS